MSVLSFDLIDGDVQRTVCPLADRQGLIDTKLRGCHRLTLREGSQVKTKLLPVRTGLQEVALLLHCREGNTERWKQMFKMSKRVNMVNTGKVFDFNTKL